VVNMIHLAQLRKPFWALLFALTFYALVTSHAVASFRSIDSDKLFGAENNDFLGSPKQFPRPVGLKDAVGFWRQVFGEWRTHQLVLHDDTHLGIVYDVVELTGYIGWKLSAEQQAVVNKHKKHLIGQLNDLDYLLHKRRRLTAEQQHLYDLITRKAGRKAIHNASTRIRIQRGMKESFQTGLEASSRYDVLMREVFQKNNLPEELAYLPHVESAFTTTARSPAGAVGVWQFMPITGKRYLRIDKSMDERYDPILATRGASKYLNYAYTRLGDWGLAVTSYNFGLSGMLRARQEYGKDIARIAKEYDSPSFGFASRNYYAEFLAVCDIMADLPRYFPKGVDYQLQPSVKPVELPEDMTSGQIAKKYRVHYTKLAELNPAWTKEAAKGKVALPARTSVWLPSAEISKKRLSAASETGLDGFALQAVSKNVSPWDILKVFPNGLSGRLSAATPQLQPFLKAIAQG
ncbi:MAG: transglycosylase SLT domain-containing protein, partial [Methylococcales bacterium]